MTKFRSCYIHLPKRFISHIGINWLTGFAHNGVRVFSNLDPSYELGSFSASFAGIHSYFEHSEFPENVDFCVIDVTKELDEVASINNYILGRNVVILNMSDSANLTSSFYSKKFITFALHNNRLARHGGTIFPLGCGVTDELVKKSGNFDLSNKILKFINNFNPTSRQSIRASLELSLVENLVRYFKVDTHNTSGDDYWAHLAESVATLAYCGEYYEDLRRYKHMRDVLQNNFRGGYDYDFEIFDCKVALFRWDCYRFWEAALFASAPVQFHFEKYGMELPVMPIPWVHYIPIDLSEISMLPDKITAILRSDPMALQKIGRNAREWVLQHYTPTKVAKYVLDKLAKSWS